MYSPLPQQFKLNSAVKTCDSAGVLGSWNQLLVCADQSNQPDTVCSAKAVSCFLLQKGKLAIRI